MELRALGFGEIFDRAITLYVRNFAPFFAIVLTLVVPYAVAQFALQSNQQGQLDAMMQAIAHPDRPPPMQSLVASPHQIVAMVTVVAIFAALWPFAMGAVAVGVARVYRGLPVAFGDCYRAVLPRWPSILAALGIEIAIVVAWYVVVVVLLGASVLVAALLVHVWLPLGALAFVVTALLGIVLLATFAPLSVVFMFAMNAIVIERRSAPEGIASAFARIFTRTEFWRALLVWIAMFAVLFGVSIFVGIVEWIAMFAHLSALAIVADALLRAAFTPFMIVLFAVYYFDVRIRREGFDLQTELEALGTSPAVSPA
jgi:hypothetical protein